MFGPYFDKVYHIVFSSSNKYLVLNIDNALEIHSCMNPNKLELKCKLNLVDQKCSHVSISENEQFVSAINKNSDLLVVFDIEEKREVFKM